jgi:hypothetical protein
MKQIKKIDMYGHSLAFNVKGQSKITSYCGSAVTLVCMSIVAAYSIYMLL